MSKKKKSPAQAPLPESNISATNTAKKKKKSPAQAPLPESNISATNTAKKKSKSPPLANNSSSTLQSTKSPPKSRQGSQGNINSPGRSPDPTTPSKIQRGIQQKSKSPEMESSPPEQKTTPIAFKQHRRFYGAVLLLHALDPVRGDRRSRAKVSDPDELSPDDLLDKFLDCVAYACDRMKGGATVTAAALQKDPRGPILLLGSNSTIQQETIEYITDILKHLKAISLDQEERTLESLEYDIVRKLTYLGAERLKAYRKHGRKLLDLKNPTFRDLGFVSIGFLKHLETVVNGDDLDALVRESYDAFKHPDMNRLLDDHESRGTNSKTVLDIRHCIGRMGAYVSVAKTFIRTTRANRALIADIQKIKVIPSSSYQPSQFLPEFCELDSIINKVCKEPDVPHYKKLLNDHNSTYELNLSANIKATSSSFKTFIHAELILIDHFRTNALEFHNPCRRYIGCSKEACYLCDQYVAAIRGPKFELRGCHQKLYPGWRPPDIPHPCETKQFNDRRDILNKMMESLREAIMTHLDQRQQRRQSHPDSTTGVSMAAPFVGTLGQAFLDARRGSESSETLGFTESEWGEEVDGRFGFQSEWDEEPGDERTDAEGESGDESDGGVSIA
ncbi:hypothetical protein K440DRAFT_658857 [Wilcoxina mikolae CBS 423.85]|nr:hypothetical protein K440DRAFT_658857 [Wilcoxina mikolae CBS 423.85]